MPYQNYYIRHGWDFTNQFNRVSDKLKNYLVKLEKQIVENTLLDMLIQVLVEEARIKGIYYEVQSN